MLGRPLAGSERKPLTGAHVVGKADPAERMEVSVMLHRSNAGALKDRVGKLARREPVGRHLSHEEFDRQFGAAPEDIAALKKFAAGRGLTITQEHAGRRTMVLSGTVAQFEAAFGVELQRFEHPGGKYRGRVGSIRLPDELQGRIEAVLGLDNRPVAKPHFRARLPHGGNRSRTAEPAASFTPMQIASLYDFPPGDGQGQCVGIIELGGGEQMADLNAYFAQLGLNVTPNVTVVSVDQGQDNPTGDPNGPDGEVMLDIELVGALAPQANIAVYFAPNTDAGFLDAITTAIHDTTNKPSVISISWGGPESSWTQQSLSMFDSAFQAAAALGITVCVASGDNGSSDGVAGGGGHVDFPASSPNVLACGGTSLQAAGNAIMAEAVWNDGPQGGATGGGISSVFAVPAWQSGLQAALTLGGATALTQRGVPDVSGDADPATGYVVRIDGTDTVIGGTSAVAPLWAGLIARINAAKGSPAGFINPILYANPGALRDIIQGNNGDFAAAAGWDACTGLGSPDGGKVAVLLGAGAGPPAA